jgi:hypothetical protein
MAATIPADIYQNLVFSLRMIQELAYIYDYGDSIEKDGIANIDGLILFMGTMFGVQSAGSLLRVASVNAAKYVSKKIMTTALTRTAWYPLLKKISAIVASRTLTKQGLSRIASKAIPVVGGVASGGITYAIMKPCANRLNRNLIQGYGENYSEEALEKDLEIIDVEFQRISKKESGKNPASAESEESPASAESEDGSASAKSEETPACH